MPRTPSMILSTLLASALLLPLAAHAEEASTATENKSWLERNVKAYYEAELSGMHTEALSGNRDGKGTSFENDHFFAVGHKFEKLGTTAMLSLWAAQVIDEDDTTKQFQPGDPFLTISKSGILQSERLATSLDGYIRFYAPVSRNTSDALNKGTVKDYGHGMMRIVLLPTKTWFDGKLTFSGNIIANFLFNGLSPDERFRRSTAQNAADGETTPASYRQDMYVILDPILDYQVSPKLDVYLEWASGYLRHYTSGRQTDISGGNSGVTHAVDSRWSSINHPTDGMYLSPGLNWAPTKKISLNPFLQYQLSAVHDTAVASVKRRVGLFHCDLGLNARYTFN